MTLPSFKFKAPGNSHRLLIALLFCLAFGAVTAKADPITFSNVVALQNGGSTQVDLFSNPGTTLSGSPLNFLIHVSGVLSPGQVDALRITYTDAGGALFTQTFDIPLFGTVAPPFDLLFTVNSPTFSFQGVAASLTVDLLFSSGDFVLPGGQAVDSYTYSFNVSQPVPEPTSILLLGVSLAGLAARFRVRKK